MRDLLRRELRGSCVDTLPFSDGDALSLALSDRCAFELSDGRQDRQQKLALRGTSVQRRIVYELNSDTLRIELLERSRRSLVDRARRSGDFTRTLSPSRT